MRSFDKALALLKNFRHHIIGRCNICGRRTIFLCKDLKTARESMFCLFCRSSSRDRHVAKLFLSLSAPSSASISEITKKSGLSIYNTDTDDSFSAALRNYPTYVSSGLFPDIKPGTEIKERVFCQDLERLSFKSETFDVVISEDIFEHVRDHGKGFREVYRVLKKGGFHIFTIPFLFDRKTLVRVDTSGPNDINLLPPEYHGDDIRSKILAYRTFGIDLYDLLNSIGFQTSVDFSTYADKSFGIVDSFVFASKK